MRILLTCFLTVFAWKLTGQVPGYQGSRFTVGYNACSFLFFDYLSNFPDGARFSYKSEIELSYTVSRKVTFSAGTSFAKQKFLMLHDDDITFEDPVTGIRMVSASKYMPVQVVIVDLAARFYSRNFIAPAGIYHKFGVGYVSYSLATPDNKWLTQGQHDSTVTHVLQGPTAPYHCFRLSYHMGRTMPIGHRFYLNTTFGLNFFRGLDSKKNKAYPNNETFLHSLMNVNLRRHNFAEIKIGFGWYAF